MQNKSATPEAIVVLGYTLGSSGEVLPLLEARLEAALKHYRPGIPLILTGGAPPSQLLKSDELIRSEAHAMQAYLIGKGIAETDLLLEPFSLTTLMNAYYSRLLHAEPLQIKRLTVVTSAFHMPLARYAFPLVFGESYPFEFIEAIDEAIEPEEKAFWEALIRDECAEFYPSLFSGVVPGDLQALHRVFQESEYVQSTERRTHFVESLSARLEGATKESLRGIT